MNLPTWQRLAADWARDAAEETPVLLFDPRRAATQVATFERELAGVEIFYAYKCFGNPELVAALEPRVSGFTVASAAECATLLDAGVAPDRLLFSNPVKVPAHIGYAAGRGVSDYAFQSVDELEKLARLAPGARVQCRVRVPDEANHDGQRFSAKFGAEPDQVPGLLEHAARVGLRPTGLTFHVGSQSTLPTLWTEAIAVCAELITAARAAGIELGTLNLGGGFPVDYRGGTDQPFRAVAAAIREAVAGLPAGLRLIAEPGRFLAADSAVILTTVIGRESRRGRDWLYCDTGVFQSLLEVLEFGRLLQRIEPLGEAGDGAPVPFTLAGPTCDGADVLGREVLLPAHTRTGDRLLITGAGAYTLAYGSAFNGIAPPRLRAVAAATSTCAAPPRP